MFVYNQVGDTFAPSKPGKPSGSSSTFDSIDLSWNASTDNFPGSLNYRVYRDGVQVGQVSSSSTTTVSFTDTSLTAGSTHTYRVDAVDAATNTSALSDQSDPITVLAPDVTPPSDPGTPTGVSNSTSTIDLSWGASTDNTSTNLTYRVFRDDASNQVDEFQSSSTGTLSFTDTGLWPGSSHTYWVQAIDEATNASNKITSAPITVTAAAFADDFAGGLSKWTGITRLSVDVLNGSAAPSAVGSPTAQTAFANADLVTPLSTICVSTKVMVTNRATTLDLFRLRTATNGAVSKVFLDTQGRLVVRSDLARHAILVRRDHACRLEPGRVLRNGRSLGLWDLYLNGTKIVNGWSANTGTTPVGRIQIGDTAAKTWTANWDDVVVDQAVG